MPGYQDMPGSVDNVTEYARPVRGWAYVALWLLSAMCLTFTILRMNYTLGPRGTDTFLNGGRPFYEPVVMEMAVVSLFTLIFCSFSIYLLRTERRLGFLSRNWWEAVWLTILWFCWIGGAGASTTIWPDLSFCVQFQQCRILQAMMAWMWLGWIVLTFLLFPALYFGASRQAWAAMVYDGWQQDLESGFTPQRQPKSKKRKNQVEVSAPIMQTNNNNTYGFSDQQQLVDQWLLNGPRPESFPLPQQQPYVAEDNVRQNLRGYN